MKRLIIFFDGTSNKFGEKNTNVVKALKITSTDNQLSCYIPGVGSMENKKYYFLATRMMKKILGLAFGYGLEERVLEAYKFLSNNYEEGDEIFVFGFSRGAYTAKVLLGLIHQCGLMGKNNEYNMRYAYNLYTANDPKFDVMAKFKITFSKFNPQIKFLGLWDSVSSVGSLIHMRNFPYTSNMQNVDHVRHALAVDEKRCMFVNNTSDSLKDSIQMWFPGVHTDIGGGQIEKDSHLSKIALKWMIDEEVKCGLGIDEHLYNRYVQGDDVKFSSPNALGVLHKNKTIWYLLNFIPRKKIVSYRPKRTKLFIPFMKYRFISPDHLIHESVFERIKNVKGYDPQNVRDWLKEDKGF